MVEYGWIRPDGTLLPGEGRHIWDGTHGILAVEEVLATEDKIVSSQRAMERLLKAGYARIWVEKDVRGTVTFAVLDANAPRAAFEGAEMFALRSKSDELFWFWANEGAQGHGSPSRVQRLSLSGLAGLRFGRSLSGLGNYENELPSWGWITPEGELISGINDELTHRRIAERIAKTRRFVKRPKPEGVKALINWRLFSNGYVRVVGVTPAQTCVYEVEDMRELTSAARAALEFFALRNKCTESWIAEIANGGRAKRIPHTYLSGFGGFMRGRR